MGTVVFVDAGNPQTAFAAKRRLWEVAFSDITRIQLREVRKPSVHLGFVISKVLVV